MKKIKRFILTFIALFIIFPCLTNAATELSASTQNPIVGKSVYVQVEANYGEKLNIKDIHLAVTYDTNYLQVEKVVWVRRDGGTNSITAGRINMDKTGADWKSGPIAHIYFKVLRAGTTKVDIIPTGTAYYTDNSQIAQTTAGIILNSVIPSTEVALGSLYIKDFNIQPAFKKSHTEYNLTVPATTTTIDIVTKKGETNQTIIGSGTKHLSFGENKFEIKVTAQNGDSRTYTINVHRTDNRTGDATLKTLQVTNTNIKIEQDKYVYDAVVSRSVDKVLISARTNDNMATLTGTGTKELQIGRNTFELLVRAASGKEKRYTINITRSTEEIEAPVLSSKLKTLKVNNLVLNLSDDNKLFLYGINKNISELLIEAIPESNTAKVEIIGNKKLKEGINPITIKVTEIIAEAIPATEETEEVPAEIEETIYTLLVYKNPSDAKEISDYNEITGQNNYVYTTTDKDKGLIPKSAIELLVNNKKTIYYNVVNIYNGLLYQVKLPTNMEKVDTNVKLTKLDAGELTYQTNLPKDTELTIYLEERYENESSVQVYSYDEEGVYTLVTAGIEVKNGYITFITNGQKNYVITQLDLIQVQSDADKLIEIIKIGLITIVICILAIILLPKLLKKKNQSQEPLY